MNIKLKEITLRLKNFIARIRLTNFFIRLEYRFQQKLIWKLRRRILFQKISKSIALLNISIWVFLFGALVWGLDKIIPFIKYITDPAIATLIGAVVGSLVGGLFAYVGAVDVHNRELEATGALKRRDDIYRPLYDELLNLRRGFQFDPFDDIFTKTFSLEHLPFSESSTWLAHYQEANLSQIPIDLAKAMNELTRLIYQGKKTESAVLKDKEFRRLLKKLHYINNKRDENEENNGDLDWKVDEIGYEMEQLKSYNDFSDCLEKFRLRERFIS